MKQKTPKGVKLTKEIEFKLTETEFAEKGKAAAALSKEIAKINVEFEGVKDTYKARIKDREAKRDDLLTVIDHGAEKRLVECTMVKSFEHKLIQYWFENEVVEERSMTESELQMELAINKAEQEEKKTKRKEKKAPAPDVSDSPTTTATIQ